MISCGKSAVGVKSVLILKVGLLPALSVAVTKIEEAM